MLPLQQSSNSDVQTEGVMASTWPFCPETQSVLKEGQKHSAQCEVLGKSLHHIGLNWEELREVSLPNLPLDSFQITQASQDSTAWPGS